MNTLADYKCECFEFDQTEAIVVFPKEPSEKRQWALKTEYWGAFPEIELMLLDKGFHIVHLKTKNRWANREDCDRKYNFVQYVAEKYNLNKKCVLVGMSCGGAQAVKYTSFYPQTVACMFIDAPVIDFCSIPGKHNADEYFNAESVWENEFMKAYPDAQKESLRNMDIHPISVAEKLLLNKIPIVMSYGTHDLTVPYEENGKKLAEVYGGSELLKVFEVRFRGHHPHCTFYDNGKIVDFILKHCE